MTEHPNRLAEASDADLARALVAAGRTLPYPEPDLVGTVSERLLPATRVPPSRTGGRPRAQARRVALVAVVLLVLAAGTAVAAGLRVPGVALRSSAPSARHERATALALDGAFLGRRVPLAEASRQVDFDVAVPQVPGLGPPEVFVADQPPGGRVSLRYPGAGVLLTQFRAELDDEFFVKGVPDAPEPVAVGETQGWWVEGRHAFVYRDADGRAVTDVVPDATGVLLWARDGVTFRLQSELPRTRALAVAESVP